MPDVRPSRGRGGASLMGDCKVDGCTRPRWARGFCSTHLAQWKKGKLDVEPDERRRVTSYSGASCSVVNCHDTATDRGMCGRHGQRMRRYGDPEYITSEDVRRINNRQSQLIRCREVRPTTYRKFFGRHTHRVVAEAKIGRPLAPGEIVHHRNEDRHDNRDSNLEVLKSQSDHTKRHRRGPRGNFA